MRILILKITACLLLLLYTAAAPAQETRNKTHIFLFDVSGSMDNYNRYNNLKEWLVRPLLRSGAFEESDTVIIRWFSKTGSVSFDPNDSHRKVGSKKYNEELVLSNVPLPGQAREANTDIPQALDLALADINGYSISGDVFIWLLTDNDQASGSEAVDSADIKPLYKRITENKNFRAAYLFPLVNENNVQLGNDKSAMIIYLLHYSTNSSWVGLDELAGKVSENIKNPVITWFPFEKGIVPDMEPLEDEELQFNGDTLILPPVTEGQAISFNNIQFKLKSTLRNRSINGLIKPDANVKLTLPPSLQANFDNVQTEATQASDGSGTEVQENEIPVQPSDLLESESIPMTVTINPREISLNPKQKSNALYNVSLSSPVTLHPVSFWTAFWNSQSEPVNGTLQFKVEDLKTEVTLDNASLARVKNGKEITSIIGQSVIENRPFSFDISYRVNYNTAWRRGLVAIVAVAIVGLIIIISSLLLLKRRYRLTTAGDEHELALPVIGRDYISVNGHHAAVISRRFSKLTIKPLSNYLIDGTPLERPLIPNDECFQIEDPQNGIRQSFSLMRVTSGSHKDITPDSFLD